MMLSVLRIAVISLTLVALVAGGVNLALARSGRATPTITKAEANAFAHVVNLKASDLPGAEVLQGAIFAPEAVQYEALKCGLSAGRASLRLEAGNPGLSTAVRRSAPSWWLHPVTTSLRPRSPGLNRRAVARVSRALSAMPSPSNGANDLSSRTQ